MSSPIKIGKDEEHTLLFYHDKIIIVGLTIREAALEILKDFFENCNDYLIGKRYSFHHSSIGFGFVKLDNGAITIDIHNQPNPMNFQFKVPDFFDELKELFDKFYQKYQNNLAFS